MTFNVTLQRNSSLFPRMQQLSCREMEMMMHHQHNSCTRTGLQPAHTISPYTGCPRRNVQDFGRVFLMLKYTDITRNTYIQS